VQLNRRRCFWPSQAAAGPISTLCGALASLLIVVRHTREF
jgi:hypothetical protein